MRQQKLLLASLSLALLACVAGRVVHFAYIGCYKDSSDRDLDSLSGVSSIGEFSTTNGVNSNSMTHELCSSICSLGGFPYFGIQVGRQCFCGQSYGSHGAALESDCGKTCMGNANQMCGDGYRNSVFALTYPKRRCFRQTARPTMTVEASWQTFWTLDAGVDVGCVSQCEASPDCQDVIFSGQQRLCHLLRFAYPPANLSGIAGVYFVRG